MNKRKLDDYLVKSHDKIVEKLIIHKYHIIIQKTMTQFIL